MENADYEGHATLVRAWIADTSSPAWTQPSMLQNFISYNADKEFQEWIGSLYRMSAEEFCATQWEKVGSSGVRTIFQPHPDGNLTRGKLTEWNQTPPWVHEGYGEWEIFGNHAIIRVGEWDTLVYFDGSGSARGPEYRNGDPVPHAHFVLRRVAPEPPPKTGWTDKLRERIHRATG